MLTYTDLRTVLRYSMLIYTDLRTVQYHHSHSVLKQEYVWPLYLKPRSFCTFKFVVYINCFLKYIDKRQATSVHTVLPKHTEIITDNDVTVTKNTDQVLSAPNTHTDTKHMNRLMQQNKHTLARTKLGKEEMQQQQQCGVSVQNSTNSPVTKWPNQNTISKYFCKLLWQTEKLNSREYHFTEQVHIL